jgi:hypothetical protein
MELDDIVASTVDTVGISAVRIGISLACNAVNINLSHLQIQYSSTSQTSNSKATTDAIVTTGKSYAGHAPDHPQGITMSDSDIVKFDYDLMIAFCSACNFHDNILDYGGDGPTHTGATVWLGPVYGVVLRNNYIANSNTNGAGVYIDNPNAVSQASNNDNIWIEGNYITSYAGSGNSMTGIELAAGSNPSRGIHIDNNHFRNVVQGIS